MKQIIHITTNAWSKMHNIINKSNSKKDFLFGVTSGGCNGFNFNLQVMPEKEEKKIMKMKPTILENKGLKVVVDPISEMHLFGTTIDYVKEDYSKGIYESKFKYDIDKSLASTCGCGVSFMPKNK
tara:strand:+ start:394 stop:768 length:375 start_codon:yes stop_codon:yes gene_type:complete